MTPFPAAAVVYKDQKVWRWSCRCCNQSEWRSRQPHALADARTHLAGHDRFGFTAKR